MLSLKRVLAKIKSQGKDFIKEYNSISPGGRLYRIHRTQKGISIQDRRGKEVYSNTPKAV